MRINKLRQPPKDQFDFSAIHLIHPFLIFLKENETSELIFVYVCIIQLDAMLLKTVHIDKPSPQLLNLVRKLQAEKEENKKRLASKKDDFFKKK